MLRFFGKTFLAAAFVLAAYLVWLLWGTGLYSAEEQGHLRQGLRDRIAQTQDDGPKPGRIVPGGAYAILQMPSIGVNAAVVEGTDMDDLRKGPGHYLKTADPWADRGAVGIAGHRTTYGAWFWALDELEEGDRIRLTTHRGVFNYEVTGLEVVGPDATEVLRQTRKPTLVLTTCHPRFSAAQRLIAFADRVEGGGGNGQEPSLGGAGVLSAAGTGDPAALMILVGGGSAALALILGGGTAAARRIRRRAG